METDVLLLVYEQKSIRRGPTTRRPGIVIPGLKALVRVINQNTQTSEFLIEVVQVIAGSLKVGDKIWVNKNELQARQPSDG